MLTYFAIILLILFLITFIALLANRVPLLDTPGLIQRLRTYLFTHVAETSPDHPFPELRTRQWNHPPERIYDRVLLSLQDLQWTLQNQDPAGRTVKAVSITPLLRFQDDVLIRVDSAGDNTCTLYLHSSSRIGVGDFGANNRHIQDFYRMLEAHLSRL